MRNGRLIHGPCPEDPAFRSCRGALLLDGPFSGFRDGRRQVGRVRTGVGTGRNIRYYPIGAEVVGIDISPAMLARAERRRATVGASVQLHQMDVTKLAFEDRSFDAAVASFLFCVLPENLQQPALLELARVVKTDGPIRLLEYVRPEGRFRRAIAKLWEPWMAWAYGAGFDRRTEEHARQIGLEITDSRFVVDDLVKLLSIRS